MSDGYKTKTVKGPQLDLKIPVGHGSRRGKAKLPVRVVRTHQIVLETRLGLPARARWRCETCDVGGEWETDAEARANAEQHYKGPKR